MVIILISTGFTGVAFIRGRRLFEAQRLLKETRYMINYVSVWRIVKTRYMVKYGVHLMLRNAVPYPDVFSYP